MIPEIGYFALVLAMALSLLLCIFPLWGAYTGNLRLMRAAPSLALGQCLFVLFSFGILIYITLTDDFTVAYVAHHSSSTLPWYYKVTSTWGGHEGAILLWLVMQSSWTALVALMSKSLPWVLRARVLGVLGFLGVGFMLYTLWMSSPFERLLPYFPVEGRDLNPLLQDPGMIIHPPLLYMGYVGLSVSFSFAIAALLTGKLDNTWAKWSRPWTMVAWAFLTLGITIGSWWAYAELGWGGWWFWDPVENASLMPWLVATALLHSLAVTEKRGVFKSWTVLLAITAFSLCLLGTFIVRSGIIVSVHAFATDPDRGLYILSFLAVVVGGSLALYAARVSQVHSEGRYRFASREVALWLNNIFLVVATLIVLLGTLLPMIHKELGLGSISIGVPFFNQMFAILIVPFALLLGIAPMLRWKQNKLSPLAKKWLVNVALSLVATAAWLFSNYEQVSALTFMATALAVWIMFSTVSDLLQKISLQASISEGFKRLGLSYWAMVLGHVGLAFVIASVTLTSAYSVERAVAMKPGDIATLNEYQYRFDGVKEIRGPNYSGHAGVVTVLKDDELVTELYAEKRLYDIGMQFMTEAAIDDGFFRDLYLALGEQMSQGAWSLRIYHKPYVRWMWLGGILISLAGFIVLADKRYRRRVKKGAQA
ncbi:heme lyase CcmF/NrfE family subunit [Pseudoalteromonas luteoviolacea]|uniref:Heme lyase subunit CcmF n=1 Tax=Pseudoalteromonas luteoviolacea S4054 TaxID=1129367 RepID=A0A0F6AEM3_9GAMM|nr:heme lyase CcmF/NrfE family subunit [Pseudoalteromonas luteoviolacea]AOT07523.1 c-type cytochrome biogenesis protein CcmF [Pseudoalteromonas luteoviolacea]AOT12439.1 c-type cytochrome biogenesis protein CcmF [Pseudoalteromonas luteoviolacea]AOT17353.1 c-type cytochrome biogenesis protein CcmF [Pseudoalteromonas luteoviolacea]KKE84667.1 heme lyase subunit CcmF [Pseudoalteromonas luteoviolacea S4054]KZN74233.1 heme lyase subunit CcmF [Pseudoalteromonas luteoviolacea S4047-1]